MNKIISIGCSYALDLSKIDGYTQIRYSYPSFSISAILEAIRYHKKQYSNSKWIVSITQVGRLVRKLPKDLHYPNYIVGTMDNPEGGYVKIGDERFSTFIERHDVIKSKSDFPLDWWENEFKTHYDKSIEEHLIEYLKCIYDIQMELNEFEYKMFLMNNTLEGYYYSSDGILRHLYSKNDKYELQDLSAGLSLETLFPELWNRIDWTKFCFYETSGNRYGGIDEYTIHNFTNEYFMDYNQRGNSPSVYGMHPADIVHLSFYENIIRKI